MEFQNICNEMVAPFLLRHPVYIITYWQTINWTAVGPLFGYRKSTTILCTVDRIYWVSVSQSMAVYTAERLRCSLSGRYITFFV